MIRVVSVIPKGEDAIDLYSSIEKWDSQFEFVWYIDGKKWADKPHLHQVGIGKLTKLAEFRKLYAHYIPPSDEFDVLKHAAKVYAVHHALSDHQGLGVFLDYKTLAHSPISESFIEDQLDDVYMSVVSRRGLPTDTSIWAVNCAHPSHKQFMDTWLRWYETGAFKTLDNWTDASTLDSTIRKFTAAEILRVGKLDNSKWA